jgi:D-glycero-alpha-D-manno-heptose 1-phosphate guanylyltransferase
LVKEVFGESFRRISLRYSEEHEPLGTGGAVLRGLEVAEPGACFILNGDTWLEVDYGAMLRLHLSLGARLTMSVRAVPNVGRYGALELRDGVVTRFSEKGGSGPGFINAGTYLLDRTLFADHGLGAAFSLERDFLAPNVERLRPVAFLVNGEFIDIGVPEDFAAAQEMFRTRGATR